MPRFLANKSPEPANCCRHSCWSLLTSIRSNLSCPLTDLNIATGAGPTRVTFNEFTPLFQRNRAQLLTTFLAGSNNTFGDEVIVSGLYNKAAISAGQFHSQTDGFRQNNDANNNIYNLFGQFDVTPALSVQTELRHRNTREGDLVLNFDRDDLFPDFQRRVNQDTFRVGARLTPFPALNVIASVFYSDRDENVRNLTFLDEAKLRKKGIKPELRAIFYSNLFNSTIGGGFYDVDVERSIFRRELDSIKQATVYNYTNFFLPAGVLPTLGLSYDSYEEGIYEFGRVNPKLGLQWNVTDNVLLKAAAFKAAKSTQVFDQTLEPNSSSWFQSIFR